MILGLFHLLHFACVGAQVPSIERVSEMHWKLQPKGRLPRGPNL